ncbi:MAG: D-aminoacyl-tRNA deacylase [Sphaerochaetaceae bacterium]
MKVVIQRVSDALITVDDITVGNIKSGLLIYFGVCKNDSDKELPYLVNKVVNMRLFNDSEGKINLSVKNANKEILVVSQFTLCANLNKGHRPSFDNAEDPVIAQQIYNKFIELLKGEGVVVKQGQFGSYMKVAYTNEGPVTIILER